jgi:transcription elongation factor Elf1
MRDYCECCYKNFKAINYIKNGKTHYRRFCNSCNAATKKKKIIPAWKEQGYKKKFKCDSCSFIAKHTDQLVVVENNTTHNTICLNCNALYNANGTLEMRSGDLRSDF